MRSISLVVALMAFGGVDHHDLSYFLDAKGQKQAVKTVADWELRRRAILTGLQRVMGDLPRPEKRCSLDVQVLEEVQIEKFIRRKITFQSEPGRRVPAYLLVPPGDTKGPAMLCLHQTTRNGKGEPVGLGGNPNLHYGLHLAQRGYVVLAPDYPSFGDHKWDFAGDHGYISGTMKAIWDNVRAVDLLASHPRVDPERIGCIGHSLGGHNAMFTAVFEPRLRVIVSSCGFSSFLKDDMPSWTGPVYMPRIKNVYKNDARQMPFDFPEIIASFAPRPFLACAALHDDDFAVAGVKECLAAAQPIYDLHGKSAHLQGYYPDSKHDFPADARQRAYDFIDQHLKK